MSAERMYVKFVETNDHEGERWVFFLPVDGNQSQLAWLQRLIAEVDAVHDTEGQYALLLDETYPESEVDIVVKHAEDGYMASATKVSGRFQLVSREFLVDDYGYGPELGGLYKGGVASLFKDE